MKPTNLSAAAPALLETLERIERDTILDRQSIEYYKRIILVHRDWCRAAIAMAKAPEIDPVSGLPFNKDESYCGECNKPAANCDCGEFE